MLAGVGVLRLTVMRSRLTSARAILRQSDVTAVTWLESFAESWESRRRSEKPFLLKLSSVAKRMFRNLNALCWPSLIDCSICQLCVNTNKIKNTAGISARPYCMHRIVVQLWTSSADFISIRVKLPMPWKKLIENHRYSTETNMATLLRQKIALHCSGNCGSLYR